MWILNGEYIEKRKDELKIEAETYFKLTIIKSLISLNKKFKDDFNAFALNK